MKTFSIGGTINNELANSFITFCSELKKEEEHVMININSGGGGLNAANTIISVMENTPNKIFHTVCTGMAASAALLILSSGDFRYATYGSMLMFHKAWSIYWGNKDEVKEQLKVSKKFIKPAFQRFYKTTKKKKKFWMSKLSRHIHEFWFNPKQAKKYGAIDYVGFPVCMTQQMVIIAEPKQHDKPKQI